MDPITFLFLARHSMFDYSFISSTLFNYSKAAGDCRIPAVPQGSAPEQAEIARISGYRKAIGGPVPSCVNAEEGVLELIGFFSRGQGFKVPRLKTFSNPGPEMGILSKKSGR